jgi:hypothetical protein
MSKREIYGEVPDKADGDSAVVKEAMSECDEHFSNKINGPTKSKTSRYDPENGE